MSANFFVSSLGTIRCSLKQTRIACMSLIITWSCSSWAWMHCCPSYNSAAFLLCWGRSACQTYRGSRSFSICSSTFPVPISSLDSPPGRLLYAYIIRNNGHDLIKIYALKRPYSWIL
ncbi:hypothetical protein DFS33DRAFT_871339 [Desarmillaria ectypa]|nr:hypothetical protein DFS33DRAFT_871339 [Desarmillaria ectypa]